jgi:hypothetical protein
MIRKLLIIALVSASLAGLGASSAAADGLPLGYKTKLYLTGAGKGSVTVAAGAFVHTYTTPSCAAPPAGNGCVIAAYNGQITLFYESPAFGSLFAGWLGTDCAGTAPACYAYNNGEMLARFEPKVVVPPAATYPLSVTLNGSGTGTVTGEAISCPGTCTHSYPAGTHVTLTASAGSLSTFTGWSGACTGTASTTCDVSMDAARNVTATFAASLVLRRSLTVSVLGDGRVTATGIDCPGDCAESYPLGAQVTLTAVPQPGWRLYGWSGACSGANATCTVGMSVSRNVTATFLPSLGSA